MQKLKFFKAIYELLNNPNQESMKLSMKDTHHKGLFSLVINGTEFGRLTRVFISTGKLKPFEVQLHTHRYPIRLTAIKGNIRQYIAVPKSPSLETVSLSIFDYKSPLNGGNGLSYVGEGNYKIQDFSLPIGSSLKMDTKEFHTISCSKGSIWIVEEQGFETESSKVLGVPFVTDGLYNEPKSFQVNDNWQLVKKELKKIILDYELI